MRPGAGNGACRRVGAIGSREPHRREFGKQAGEVGFYADLMYGSTGARGLAGALLAGG